MSFAVVLPSSPSGPATLETLQQELYLEGSLPRVPWRCLGVAAPLGVQALSSEDSPPSLPGCGRPWQAMDAPGKISPLPTTVMTNPVLFSTRCSIYFTCFRGSCSVFLLRQNSSFSLEGLKNENVMGLQGCPVAVQWASYQEA